MIDSYPLPENPPLLLLQDTFATVVDFNLNPQTFSGSFVSFSAGNSSDSGFTEDDVIMGEPASDSSAGVTSISLSGDLAAVLMGQQDPRIAFTVYATEGLFLERQEYVSDSNRTALILGSVVVAARVSGGVTVSDIENVVTLTFAKNQVVRNNYKIRLLYLTVIVTSNFLAPPSPKAMENGSISICVFWDQALDEGYGGWSGEGCRLAQENELTAVCTCDHLTSFSLLVVRIILPWRISNNCC